MAAKASTPILRCTGTTWDAYGNFLQVFTLTNPTDRPMLYDGYGTNSPRWTEQAKFSTNQNWKTLHDETAYCGVDLGNQHLPPGQSATFTGLAPKGASLWRIGIKYTFDPRLTNSPDRLVWSPAVTMAAKSQSRPEASTLVKLEVEKKLNQKFPYAFTVTNISSKEFYYGGFRERDVPPIYLNAERHHGSWENKGSCVWNGEGSSGFGFHKLAPGKSKTFSIPAQAEVVWRIGLILYPTNKPTAYEDAYLPVWWPAQPPRDKD